MHSDELFPQANDTRGQWEGLEKRINRLLEGIVQLRNANAQIMKENVLLKNQLREAGNNSNGSSGDLEKLRKQYDEAIQDLKQVRQNLKRLEELEAELKTEG